MQRKRERQLHIGFLNLANASWVAGAHYLKNLFAAIQSLELPRRPEVVLLQAPGSHPGRFDEPGIGVDRTLTVPPDPLWFTLLRGACRRLPASIEALVTPRPPLGAYMRKHGLDVAFGYVEYGARFNVPLLSWIPDFQHLHLPDMFPAQETAFRNRYFARIASNATRIVVSSQQALEDLQHFAPRSAVKGRVLPFVAQVPDSAYSSDPAWVCGQYHIPHRFVYLPNQFWRHKNHRVVIQALSLARTHYPPIAVVCTGNTHDDRDPTYFARLLADISRQGLRDNLIVLGMIPHEHLFALIRQSLAVLQPSQFEGWSTTVEETKSLGKSIILSDIPVHREQAPARAAYFDPTAPERLAECLLAAFEQYEPGPDRELEAAARSLLPVRTKAFGEAFLKIVEEALCAR